MSGWGRSCLLTCGRFLRRKAWRMRKGQAEREAGDGKCDWLLLEEPEEGANDPR